MRKHFSRLTCTCNHLQRRIIGCFLVVNPPSSFEQFACIKFLRMQQESNQQGGYLKIFQDNTKHPKKESWIETRVIHRKDTGTIAPLHVGHNFGVTKIHGGCLWLDDILMATWDEDVILMSKRHCRELYQNKTP